jgi:hypothetical protein
VGNCCTGKRANVQYEVTIPGQPTVRKDTVAEAQQVLTAAGKPAGSAIKAVPK